MSNWAKRDKEQFKIKQNKISLENRKQETGNLSFNSKLKTALWRYVIWKYSQPQV